MLSLVDVIDMSECTEEEVDAIAIHEGIPEVVAAEMASYLIHCPDGVTRIRKIIIEDIEYAKRKGRCEEAEKLRQVLLHFIASHPDYKGEASA